MTGTPRSPTERLRRTSRIERRGLTGSILTNRPGNPDRATNRLGDLDRATALEAARLSILHGMAMADSVMLATAQRHDATLWTQDADFDGLAGARYYPKR